MLMPFELYNGATCPYCGKGIIKVSEGRCNICKREFATVWEDDGKGNEKNVLVDHKHVQDFLADFMNPPERNLDNIVLSEV